MRSISSFDLIYLHRQPVDGRKRINGLSQIVKEAMGHDPFGPGLFVFTSKRMDQVRLLYWDRSGFAMWIKRLEKDKFRWPRRLHEDVVELTSQELAWLLDGIDITTIRPHETLQYSAL